MTLFSIWDRGTAEPLAEDDFLNDGMVSECGSRKLKARRPVGSGDETEDYKTTDVKLQDRAKMRLQVRQDGRS